MMFFIEAHNTAYQHKIVLGYRKNSWVESLPHSTVEVSGWWSRTFELHWYYTGRHRHGFSVGPPEWSALIYPPSPACAILCGSSLCKKKWFRLKKKKKYLCIIIKQLLYSTNNCDSDESSRSWHLIPRWMMILMLRVVVLRRQCKSASATKNKYDGNRVTA